MYITIFILIFVRNKVVGLKDCAAIDSFLCENVLNVCVSLFILIGTEKVRCYVVRIHVDLVLSYLFYSKLIREIGANCSAKHDKG